MMTRCKLLLLLLFAFLFGNQQNAISQALLETQVSLSTENVQIDEMLSDLSAKSGIYFTFSSLIDISPRITPLAGLQTIRQHLDHAFGGAVIYKEYNRKILLLPNPAISHKEARKQPIVLKGIILDRKTKTPIPAANIYLSQQSTIGMISDVDGTFEWKLAPELAGQPVTVSFLGYTPEHFIIPRQDSVLTIRMRTSRMFLNETVIEYHDPLSLLKKAINTFSSNYSQTSATYTALFREHIKHNNRYISISEALISILRKSSESYKYDKIKLLAGRNESFARQNAPDLTVEGSLYHYIKLDVVKYGVNFLSAESFNDYSYSYKGLIRLGERWAHIIVFKHVAGEEGPYYDGMIFIDKETLAISRLEFGISARDLANTSKSMIRDCPVQLIPDILGTRYVVSYEPHDGKWHLSNVWVEVNARIYSRQSRQVNFYKAVSEFFIFNQEPTPFAYDRDETFASRYDILFDQIKDCPSYLWTTRESDPNEDIRLRTSRFLHENPYVAANWLDPAEYGFETDQTETLVAGDAKRSKTTISKKTFVERKTNVSVFNVNELILGKRLNVSHLTDSLEGDTLDNSRYYSEQSDKGSLAINLRLSALEIIHKALARIKDNYFMQPAIMTAMFRESILNRNHAISTSEAVVNVYKENYNSWRNDQVRLVASRNQVLKKEAREINFTLQGGLTNTLQLDIVKYKANFIDPAYFDFYDYQLTDLQMVNGHLCYVIDFDQREMVNYPLFKGRMYIDTKSFAFVKADFGYSPIGMRFAARMLVVKVPPRYRVMPFYTHYHVSYQNLGARWMPEKLSAEVSVSVTEKTRRSGREAEQFTAIAEYLFTHCEEDVPAGMENFGNVRATDIFAERVTNLLQNELWCNYTQFNNNFSIEDRFANLSVLNSALILENQVIAIQ